jgi:hypothetical protein
VAEEARAVKEPTILDIFACFAMIGLMNRQEFLADEEYVSKEAFSYAEAMLNEAIRREGERNEHRPKQCD